MVTEKKKRSIAKALSWRVTATLITTVLVFIFTGQFTLAISVGVVEVLLKMLAYYAHERSWDKINWGRF